MKEVVIVRNSLCKIIRSVMFDLSLLERFSAGSRLYMATY